MQCKKKDMKKQKIWLKKHPKISNNHCNNQVIYYAPGLLKSSARSTFIFQPHGSVVNLMQELKAFMILGPKAWDFLATKSHATVEV